MQLLHNVCMSACRYVGARYEICFVLRPSLLGGCWLSILVLYGFFGFGTHELEVVIGLFTK